LYTVTIISKSGTYSKPRAVCDVWRMSCVDIKRNYGNKPNFYANNSPAVTVCCSLHHSSTVTVIVNLAMHFWTTELTSYSLETVCDDQWQLVEGTAVDLLVSSGAC